MPQDPPLILRSIGKSLPNGRQLFRDIDLVLEQGELVSIQGESGIGKSTLLNLAAGLDRPSIGEVVVSGRSLSDLSETGLTAWRGEKIGFVFQAFHILPFLSLDQNVALPAILVGEQRGDALGLARDMLARVGLGDRTASFASELSGGEMQRVAIARALVHSPAVILADEPTGNLDPATSADVIRLLTEVVRNSGAAMLLVTHSVVDAEAADRHLEITPEGIRTLDG